MVHICAYLQTAAISNKYLSIMPSEFLAGVVKTSLARLPDRLCGLCLSRARNANRMTAEARKLAPCADELPYVHNPCVYHEHEDDEEAAACLKHFEKDDTGANHNGDDATREDGKA